MTISEQPRVLFLARDQAVDRETIERHVVDAAVALGVDASVVWVGAGEPWPDLSAPDAASTSGRVVMTAPGDASVGALSRSGTTLVRLDLGWRDDVERVSGLVAHVHGRGVWGVTWAMRALVNHLRWPATTIGYGAEPEQFGQLRVPPGRSAPVPVVLLVHGGFWRSKWDLDLMDALAIDIAERGWASWNVEYRRPDRHGWDATVADADAALRYLAVIAEAAPIDLSRVVLAGHSAGGQLVVQMASMSRRGPVRPALVVPIAACADLVETHRRHLGDGAVAQALGGSPEQQPDRYREASPIELLPLDLAQLIVTGSDDSADLGEMNRRYATAARIAGDHVTELSRPGDHFAVIDPSSAVWKATARAIDDHLGHDRPGAETAPRSQEQS